MAPRDAVELEAMLDLALNLPGPAAIRYPRGAAAIFPAAVDSRRQPLAIGKAELLRDGSDAAVLAYGRLVWPALAAAEELQREGIALTVYNMRFAKPLDREAICRAAATGLLITAEDHVLAGGFGSAVAEAIADGDIAVRLLRLGVPDRFIGHGLPDDLDRQLGFDVPGLVQNLRAAVQAKGERSRLAISGPTKAEGEAERRA